MKLSTIVASASLVLFPILAIAHGGGVNSYGCHNQSSTSTHHCHSGDYNGMSFASQADFLAYIADQSNSSGNDASGDTSDDTADSTDSSSDSSEDSTYNRDDYLPYWADADGDCINTRHEVLILESRVPVTMTENGCSVAFGEWYDPLTDQTFTDPSDVDIDHHVALSEAHRSGAAEWDTAKKRAFANDLVNSYALQAMDDSTNASKSDNDPANWLPPNESFRCDYVKNWVEVKSLYALTYDDAEKAAIESILGTSIGNGARQAVSGLQASTSDVTGRFSLGITNGESCGYSPTGNVYSSVLIDFAIAPKEEHLNELVDILVVAVLGTDIYSISNQLQLVPYTGDASQLVAFVPQTTFKESRQFEFIQTSFDAPINVSLYLAYRLENGDLVYSSQPFSVTIN